MLTLLYIMTTIRSGFLLTPIKMTLMSLNAKFILKQTTRLTYVVAFRADNA